MLKIWLRLHGFELCSWTFVWDNLRTAFEAQGDEILYEDTPENPNEWVELWWGDPQYWQWSGLPVKAKIALALSEAHSILERGRDRVIDNINEADMLICPSEFATTAFKEAPIDTPMRIVFFGVDDKEFKYVERNWKSTIKFLHGGVTQFRKGSWLVPEAFIDTFDRSDDVSLTIASPKPTDMFVKLKMEYGSHPNIDFISDMQDSAMDLYSDHHVYVSPHLSEGFGLMIPEAMATGMPCLVARCSSPREFFDEKYGWWIEMSEGYAAVSQCLPQTNGFWRIPSVKSLAKGMKRAYDSVNESKEKGIAGSEYVLESLTWGVCVSKIKKVIEEVLSEEDKCDSSCVQRGTIDRVVLKAV